MSYSISLLRAAHEGCRNSGGSLVVQFFHEGERLSGVVIGAGSKLGVQLLESGTLVENVEARQVTAADIMGVTL